MRTDCGRKENALMEREPMAEDNSEVPQLTGRLAEAEVKAGRSISGTGFETWKGNPKEPEPTEEDATNMDPHDYEITPANPRPELYGPEVEAATERLESIKSTQTSEGGTPDLDQFVQQVLSEQPPSLQSLQFEQIYSRYNRLRGIDPATLNPPERAAYPALLEQTKTELNELFKQAKESGILLDVDEELNRVYDLVRYKFRVDPALVNRILEATKSNSIIAPDRSPIKTEKDLEDGYWYLFGGEGIESWDNAQLKGARGVYYKEGLRRIAQEFAVARGATISNDQLRLEEWEWNLEERRDVEPKLWTDNGYRIEFNEDLVRNQGDLERAYRQYIRNNIDLFKVNYKEMLQRDMPYLSRAIIEMGHRLGLEDSVIKRSTFEAKGRMLVLLADYFAATKQEEYLKEIMETFSKGNSPEMIEAANRAYGGRVWLAAVLLESEFVDIYKEYEGEEGERINLVIDQGYYKEDREKQLIRRIAKSRLTDPKNIERLMSEDANESWFGEDSAEAKRVQAIYDKQDRGEQISLSDQSFIKERESEAKEAVEIAKNLFSGLGWKADLMAPRVWIYDKTSGQEMLISVEDAVQKELGANFPVNYNYFMAFDDNARQTLLGPLQAERNGQPIRRPARVEQARRFIDPDGSISRVNERFSIIQQKLKTNQPLDVAERQLLEEIEGVNKDVMDRIQRKQSANEKLTSEEEEVLHGSMAISLVEWQKYKVFDKMREMRDAYFDAFYRLRMGNDLKNIELRRSGRVISYAEAMVWGSGQPLGIKKYLYFPEYILSLKKDYAWKPEYFGLAQICETRVRSVIRELGFRSYREFSAALGLNLASNKTGTQVIDSYEVERYYDRWMQTTNQYKRAMGGQIGQEYFIGFLISAMQDVYNNRASSGYNSDQVENQEQTFDKLKKTLHRPLQFAQGFFAYENDRTNYVHDSMRDGHWFLDKFIDWLSDPKKGGAVYPAEHGWLVRVLEHRRQNFGENNNFSYYEELKRREIK